MLRYSAEPMKTGSNQPPMPNSTISEGARMADKPTITEQVLLDSYWSAKTPAEEREAVVRLKEAGMWVENSSEATKAARPSVPIHHLAVAEVPAKADLLELIEQLREGVESGQVLSMVAIPIYGMGWGTLSAGNISMRELAGVLGRAWLDATEALKA